MRQPDGDVSCNQGDEGNGIETVQHQSTCNRHALGLLPIRQFKRFRGQIGAGRGRSDILESSAWTGPIAASGRRSASGQQLCDGDVERASDRENCHVCAVGPISQPLEIAASPSTLALSRGLGRRPRGTSTVVSIMRRHIGEGLVDRRARTNQTAWPLRFFEIVADQSAWLCSRKKLQARGPVASIQSGSVWGQALAAKTKKGLN